MPTTPENETPDNPPVRKRNVASDVGCLFIAVFLFFMGCLIIIPNLAVGPPRGPVTSVVSEIESIELALSAMLADTGQNSLGSLFNTNTINHLLDTWNTRFPKGYFSQKADDTSVGTMGRYRATLKLYTNTCYALMRSGNRVLNPDMQDEELKGLRYSEILNPDLVKRMGTNYLPEIAEDPYGNLYNIYPGPWDAEKDVPIPFRSYLLNEGDYRGTNISNAKSKPKPDRYTFEITNQETGIKEITSFPANHRKAFYVWSNGQNEENNQVLGEKDSKYKTYATDDINNWDSGSSWQGFYN